MTGQDPSGIGVSENRRTPWTWQGLVTLQPNWTAGTHVQSDHPCYAEGLPDLGMGVRGAGYPG